MKNFSLSLPVLLLLALLAAILAAMNAHAEAPTMHPMHPIVPKPRELKPAVEDFILKPETRILLARDNAKDWFAAEQLRDEIKQLAGREIPIEITPGWPGDEPCILIARPGELAEADAQLKAKNLAIGPDFSAEGYALDVTAARVILSANASAGIFYGVQTLKQMLITPDATTAWLSGASIRDWPAMRYRIIQDDINRGPVPTLDYMKEQVRLSAAFKLNMYCIYAENLYQSKKHPIINPRGATLTPDQIKELIDFARPYHVEILPQQQTFGHLHGVVRHELYNDLAERPHNQILTPENEQSYTFISDTLSEIMPQFPCEFFHIGCDETFELGMGKSKAHVEKDGKGIVYISHLKKVAEIAKPYHKKLLFWGEIALQHPELIAQLPENMIAVAWDYLPRDTYDNMIEPYQKAGVPTLVAPAAFYGGRLFPDYVAHLPNIRNFVRDGQKHGSLGMLNTTWDDLGEDLFGMGWYGVGYGAAAAWQPGESSIEEYRDAFDWAFYRNGENHAFAEAIEKLSQAHQKSGVGALNAELFWVNPFTKLGQIALEPITPDAAREVRLLTEQAWELVEKNRDKARLNAVTLDTLVFGARRMDFVGMKVQFARELRAIYEDSIAHKADLPYVSMNFYDSLVPYASRLADLRDFTMELREMHRELWLRENRPYTIDIIFAKYDHLLNDWQDEVNALSLANQQLNRDGALPPPETVNLLIK